MSSRGRLPASVHLVVAIGSCISAFILARTEGVVWLLAMGMMLCSGNLYIQRLKEAEAKR